MFISNQEMFDIPAEETSDQNQLIHDPVVSVILITFNHDEFIAEAIDSILRQQTDIPYEILIGEDKSTDKTLGICRSYQKQYPDRIRLITAQQNVGMHHNIARLWCRCRGKYIAFCEGDDFWCDDHKLDKQAEFLDNHPEFSMCGTYTDRIEQMPEGWQVTGRLGPGRIKESYDVADLIPRYNFHTSSILLRKSVIRFPAWFWKVYCADRPLYILCAEKGPVGIIPECMSVYRLHDGGIWSPVMEMDKAKKGITLFKYIDEYFQCQYHKLIKRTLSQIIWSYATECLFAGDYKTGRKLFRLSMGYAFPKLPASFDMFVKSFIRLYFPAFYNRYRRR